MRTAFTPIQLTDPAVARADRALRACVHCGLCTAVCPTYQLTGNELDGPRGRIGLIQGLLERDGLATPTDVTHLDRCLGCFACMPACPSGVNYEALLDVARERMAEHAPRPSAEKAMRALLAAVLPFPRLFRLALRAAGMARPFGRLLPARLRGLVEMAPATLAPTQPANGTAAPRPGPPATRRVVVLRGCVQQVLRPSIHAATRHILEARGCTVLVPTAAGCCGALSLHLGRREEARGFARANLAAWNSAGEIDAVIVDASGCGSVVKQYGALLADDPQWAAAAQRLAERTLDLSEAADRFKAPELSASASSAAPPTHPPTHGLRVAYHAACSLQHEQRVHEEPRSLLAAIGCTVLEVPDGHLCCGSAGTYNLLQPEVAAELRERKLAAIDRLDHDLVVTGNIGCITQLEAPEATGSGRRRRPVVHLAELLDWAGGGPPPPGCSELALGRRRAPGDALD